MKGKRRSIKMDNNPSAGSGHGSNFFSGFLLGALVGAGLVFLFGTKKGKKLLRIISEKGADNISSILEKAEKTADLAEIQEEDELSFAKASEDQGGKFTVKEKTVEEKPKVKRFFKGISRHLN